MKRTLPLLLAFTITLVFNQCSKDKNNGGGTTTVDCSTVTNKAFAANVNPLIQSRCAIAGCHAAGSGNGPGALTTYSQITAGTTPSRIRQAVAAGTMPQGSSLTTAEKNSIICWIDSGTPNN